MIGQPVDGQIVDDALGKVDHALTPGGLRQADDAVIGRSANVEMPSVAAVAGVEILPLQRKEFATPETAQRGDPDDDVIGRMLAGQREQHVDLVGLQMLSTPGP
jgi:hypothetical protein